MEFSPAQAVALREAAGLSQRAAARESGLSRQGLRNVEEGTNAPTVTTLSRLATIYGREPGEFFIEGDHAQDADTPGLACATPGDKNAEARAASSARESAARAQ
jgi:transcriptional regulator with XRE-family HTH domain